MSKDEDYVPIQAEKVRFLDESGVEGVVLLASSSYRTVKYTKARAPHSSAATIV
jgi:hypothetical protein